MCLLRLLELEAPLDCHSIHVAKAVKGDGYFACVPVARYQGTNLLVDSWYVQIWYHRLYLYAA